MRCLETRTTPDGLKWRRYRRDDGTTFRTFEVPAEVWGSIVKQGRLNDRLKEWRRGQERKQRKIRAQELLAQGWKPLAVAVEIGVSETSVLRYGKEIRDD